MEFLYSFLYRTGLGNYQLLRARKDLCAMKTMIGLVTDFTVPVNGYGEFENACGHNIGGGL